MRCDIIIPVWNQLKVTKDCIDSILKHTDYPYRLVIIDNGSDGDTKEYLKGLAKSECPDIRLIRNEKNLGFVKAVNQGIGQSDAPYLCLMNNDTVATGGWLKEMIRVMELKPGVGIVNPSSNTSGQFRGGKSIDDYATGLKRFSGQTQELCRARGFCMLMKREVIEKVGLFDESYNVGFFEETDYCKRAHENGFVSVRARGAYVYHKESVTFNELGNKDEIFKENEKIFVKRWGRPLRIGYFLDRIGSAGRINDIATSAARSGHQVWIFLKRGLDWPVSIDHFDIRRVDMDNLFFGLGSVYQVIKRRKKKSLDIILTDNRLLGMALKMKKVLHGSDVIIGPDEKKLAKILEEKSHGG